MSTHGLWDSYTHMSEAEPKPTVRNDYARAYTDGVLATARMVALAERKRAMLKEQSNGR